MIKSIIWIALVCAAFLGAQVRMRPGLWETTFTHEGKSVTHSRCTTDAELALSNGTPQAIRESMLKSFARIGNGTCTVKDFRIDATSMTSLVTCRDSSFAHVTKFNGDTTDTTSTTTKAGVVTVTHITGRRVGVCPPVSKP